MGKKTLRELSRGEDSQNENRGVAFSKCES